MIHLFYGDSAAESFACFNKVSESIIFREALLCGPAALPSASWREERARHLADAYDADVEECRADLIGFESALQRLSGADELVCWFGRDLFCQVGWIYCLVRLAEFLPMQVSLVCPKETDESVYCFGDLAPAEMNGLLAERVPVERLDFQQAAIAYHLYAAADPRGLNGVFDGSMDVGPRFAAALELHASRFPWLVDGLGTTERKILGALRKGPRPFSELFQEVSQKTREFTWGDLQVRNMCWRLASGPTPLLTLPEGTGRDSLLGRELCLSTEGQAVIAGERSASVTSPYWLGGCELSCDSPWRWDPATRRIVD